MNFVFNFWLVAVCLSTNGVTGLNLTGIIEDMQEDILKLQQKVVLQEEQLNWIQDQLHAQQILIKSIETTILNQAQQIKAHENFIDALNEEVANVKADVVDHGEQIRSHAKKITQQQGVIDSQSGKIADMEQQIQGLQRSCITDLKLTPQEHAQIWQGPGFTEQHGFLITSVSNWDQDAFVDFTTRRQIQYFVNKNWHVVNFM